MSSNPAEVPDIPTLLDALAASNLRAEALTPSAQELELREAAKIYADTWQDPTSKAVDIEYDESRLHIAARAYARRAAELHAAVSGEGK